MDRQGQFASPVTSSNNDRLPTTGDVHLYADPLSYHSKVPLLYADCEGLDGGESIPKGLRHRTREKEDAATSIFGLGGRSRSASTARTSVFIESKKKLKKCRHGSERDIAWAITPETRKREYSVTQLYPRLLYTFSDVVVFVLRNPR